MNSHPRFIAFLCLSFVNFIFLSRRALIILFSRSRVPGTEFRNNIIRSLEIDGKVKFLHKTESMASILTAVFKATIGLLMNKGRDLAAEKLKDGDGYRPTIQESEARWVGENASFIEFQLLQRRLEFLYQLFQQATRGSSLQQPHERQRGKELEEEKLAFTLNLIRSSTGGLNLKPSVNAGSLAKGLKNLDPTEFDEPSKQALSNAKRRFKESRKKATDALNNTALRTSDRILAMTDTCHGELTGNS